MSNCGNWYYVVWLFGWVMILRFVSFGSGSEGNVLFVEFVSGVMCMCILLDCGFGICEVVRWFECLGCMFEFFNVIFVMYEYSDYVGSVYVFVVKFNIFVWISYGMYCVMEKLCGVDCVVVCFCCVDDMFCVGDL